MAQLAPYFSESGYAFAFLENLLRDPHLRGRRAPRFITTVAEGRGRHYDVHLPTRVVAFFFQFKIPEVLQRGAGLTSGARLNTPFYRMNLRHENAYAQHLGLLALEASGANIYYTTPRFHTEADMDFFFRRRRVPSASAWFRPSRVTPPNYVTPHGVAYDESGLRWEVRSRGGETQEGGIDMESFLAKWFNAQQTAPVTTLARFCETLSGHMDAAVATAREARAAAELEERTRSKRSEEEQPPNLREKFLREPTDEQNVVDDLALKARNGLGLTLLLSMSPVREQG